MSKYDAPCAVCARVLPGTSKSLPAGQRLCHDCRARRRAARQPAFAPVQRPCTVCANPFEARHPKAKYCGRKCKLSHAPGGPPSRNLDVIRTKAKRATATARTCCVCLAGFRAKGLRRRCLRCQASGFVIYRECETCRSPFFSRQAEARWCSMDCAGVEIDCIDCGQRVRGSWTQKRCADCADDAARAYWRRKNAVRRGADPVGRRMTIVELGDRDGWVCHLCLRPVYRSYRAPDPRSPTFDHLIPVSDHGNDAPENLRLAHWRCNSSRGAGGTVQLLLFG